jgi:hypothetical protein
MVSPMLENLSSYWNYSGVWNGFSAWFDCGFAKRPPYEYSCEGEREEDEETILSTSPFAE